VIVHFVDIEGIDDHHCVNFLFINVLSNSHEIYYFCIILFLMCCLKFCIAIKKMFKIMYSNLKKCLKFCIAIKKMFKIMYSN
jgi:hypothetical protein